MAGEPLITLTGNVGADPELKFAPSGDAVCTVKVAVTPRRKNRDKWEDGQTRWYKVSVWKSAGEAVAEHVRKGDRVTLSGRFDLEEYEKDGRTITVPAVTADQFGVVPKMEKRQEREETPW